MAKLTWDAAGERLYETGTHKGVLFAQTALGTYRDGVAWNGLTKVTQSPDGAEETPIYADNIKYLSLTSVENFKGTIEAYTYPYEFAVCDGSTEVVAGVHVGQQRRMGFGLAYSTIVGNDVAGNRYGEKIHIIYAAKVTPTERAYETVNGDPNAITFSWAFTTTPQQIAAPGFKPSAYICIDSTIVDAHKFAAIKDLLYGTEAKTSKLPTIDEIITLVTAD